MKRLWELLKYLIWDAGWWGGVVEDDDDSPAPDLAETLRQLAGTLRDVARFTSTTLDDRLAKLVQLALANDVVMALIVRLLGDPAVTSRVDGDRDAAMIGLASIEEPSLKPIVEAAGLQWSDFVKMLLVVVRYLLSATGRRAWKLPWAPLNPAA